MIKHFLAAVAVALALWSFSPAKPKPIAPQKGKIAVALEKATKADRDRVASFYDSFADVVGRDQVLFPTVGAFRRIHANSLDAAFKGTDLPGKYAGLDAAIEEQLVAAIGKDDVALTAEKRQALTQTLTKVAADAR